MASHSPFYARGAEEAATDDWGGPNGRAGLHRPHDERDATRAGPARRILIVLHDLSGGGTEHVAIRLANCWSEAVRAVTVFCGAARGVLRDGIAPGVAVIEANPACPRGLFSRYVLAGRLAEFVRSHPQDIVFAPGNFHLPILARFARFLPRVPTLCKISNQLAPLRHHGLLHRVRRTYVHWATRRLTGLVAMSPSQYHVARMVVPDVPMTIAWEPILEFDLPPPREKAVRTRILAIGRLESQKNFHLALRAFATFRRSHDAELVILGEGKERDSLSRLAKRLGIAADVSMPGHSVTVAAHLARASILLMTSRFEGFPAVLVEAAAMSVPIVTTPCSDAIAEIVPRGHVLLVVSAEANSVAKAMVKALEQDQALRVGQPTELVRRHLVSNAGLAYLEVLDATVRRKARQRAEC